MNNFGGDWTSRKIEILVEYARAYLTIMNKYSSFQLLYFDGFAGSGSIINGKNINIEKTIGAAVRILEISIPKPFNMYYFVEKNKEIFENLKKRTKDVFSDKKIYVYNGDCNEKMIALADFMKAARNENIRTLAYIDPCGMQVEWNSIQALSNLPIDMWILVPTGLGVNRLLKNNGDLNDKWINKLEKFLGLSHDEIHNYFYTTNPTLFPEITINQKIENAVEKSAVLYKSRLLDVFKYVSEPFVLKNSSNSIMYHLFLTSNNKAALRIANDIVEKYNQ